MRASSVSTSDIAVENAVADLTHPVPVDSPADSSDQAVQSDEVAPVAESEDGAAADAGES